SQGSSTILVPKLLFGNAARERGTLTLDSCLLTPASRPLTPAPFDILTPLTRRCYHASATAKRKGRILPRKIGVRRRAGETGFDNKLDLRHGRCHRQYR